MIDISTKGGAINISGLGSDLIVINPSNFDWKPISSNYQVRDNIDKQTYKLGNLANIQSNGVAFGTDAELITFLNSLVNTAGTNSVDVAIQDQTTPDISLFLGQELDTFVLDANYSIDDETIAITTTGFVPVVGNFIFLKEIAAFYQAEVLTVAPIAGNQYTITIAIPLDYAFTVAAVCVLQNVNMNVDGSALTKEFFISPSGLAADQKWDINRMGFVFTMSSAGDDGLFGNIAKLSKGCYFRTKNGITQNLFNIRDNSDIAVQGAQAVDYNPRSGGGGTFGALGRVTFNGQEKRGIVKRLKAVTDDKFQGFVRDNLTGNTSYRVNVQGQIVED